MSLFGISIESKDFWNGCKRPFQKIGAYLSKTEEISRHDVADKLGGLEAYPVRDDLWTIRLTSLRGGGYNRFHRFHSSETGVSLVGTASVWGKEGKVGDRTAIDVSVFVDLEREEGKWFPTEVQISGGNGSDDMVTERRSKILVDGETIIEWHWQRRDGDRFVRQRLFYGDGATFRPLMENLEYKKGLDADSIRLRFEWEDVRVGEEEPERYCIEATGKGMWEVCMRLSSRLKSSTENLLWHS